MNRDGRVLSLTVTLAGAAALLVGSAGRARAHVKYVTPGSDPVAVVKFLVEALTDPFNVAVLAVGALAVAAFVAAYLRYRPFEYDVAAFREAMLGYRDLLPWLLRLSIGLPLVGAGFSGYLFSPIVEPAAPTFVRLFGIAVGFLLLFGLATRLVAIVGLIVYLAALPLYPEILLAFEYVPGFLAIALVGSGRPSADEVIASLAADDRTRYSRIDPLYRRLVAPFRRRTEPYASLAPTVVRVGLGFTFVYLGVADKLMAPGEALAVVEKYDLTAVVPVAPELWVVGAGLTEVLIGVVLALGLLTRLFSGVALGLFTVTLFGLPDDPVLAHVTLFGLVSALLITGAGPYSLDARPRVDSEPELASDSERGVDSAAGRREPAR